MKTIDIRGKQYVTVNERLKEFRSMFKDYALIGRIVEQTPDSVIFEAQIIDDKGIIRANGFARETLGKGGVNKFAMYENAETSAWGRALGNFGIGIDTAVCTADELQTKLSHEDDTADNGQFEKDAAAAKRNFTAAVKANDPAKALPKKPLSERVAALKVFLTKKDKESWQNVIASRKDEAHAVIDAALSAPDPLLQAAGTEMALIVKAFETIDDNIPY